MILTTFCVTARELQSNWFMVCERIWICCIFRCQQSSWRFHMKKIFHGSSKHKRQRWKYIKTKCSIQRTELRILMTRWSRFFLSCAFRAVTWESCNTLAAQSQTAGSSKLLFYIGSYCTHMCRLLFPNPAFNVSAPRLLIFPCATGIPAAKDVSSPLCGFSS